MKIKNLIFGILAMPLLVPIMVIASIQDNKALKKELEEHKKHSNSRGSISENQETGEVIK
ncbi:hypothetical protein WH285_16845 [Acinetobacter johnsonii]|uniref:hypothetical protein n=1 Tax=Acinetobacter johnsonii TaxID=40214 RepID=UPI0030ABB89B